MGRAVELKQPLDAAQKEGAGEAQAALDQAVEPCPFAGCDQRRDQAGLG
jgi:hypothetical protein